MIAMRNGRIFPLIIFLIVFVNIIGPFTGLVFSFIPIFIIGFIFFGILNNVYKKDKRPQNSSKRRKATRKAYTHQYEDSEKSFVSNADKSKIDDTLREYFKEHYELPIYDDIALVTKNGSYKSFEDLYIAKNKEVIMSLDEFGDMHASTYDQIVSLLKLFKNEKKEEKPAKVKEKTPIYTSEAQKYIAKINALNNGIPQEEIASGLNQTCLLLKQIELSADDDDDAKIDKLYDYYLPILLKILENYKTLLKTGAKGEEFNKAESQLIKTILLINEALKTINESLHEDDYMNLSADITTLQSLLKKDGLVKEGSLYEGQEENHNGR